MIYRIKCNFSEKKVYIKEHGNDMLPVRLGPSSELLQGREADDYIESRDKKRQKKI